MSYEARGWFFICIRSRRYTDSAINCFLFITYYEERGTNSNTQSFATYTSASIRKLAFFICDKLRKARDWFLFASVAADIRIAAACFLFITCYKERHPELA